MFMHNSFKLTEEVNPINYRDSHIQQQEFSIMSFIYLKGFFFTKMTW